jgi:hypothetical protein
MQQKQKIVLCSQIKKNHQEFHLKLYGLYYIKLYVKSYEYGLLIQFFSSRNFDEQPSHYYCITHSQWSKVD